MLRKPCSHFRIADLRQTSILNRTMTENIPDDLEASPDGYVDLEDIEVPEAPFSITPSTSSHAKDRVIPLKSKIKELKNKVKAYYCAQQDSEDRGEIAVDEY